MTERDLFDALGSVRRTYAEAAVMQHCPTRRQRIGHMLSIGLRAAVVLLLISMNAFSALSVLRIEQQLGETMQVSKGDARTEKEIVLTESLLNADKIEIDETGYLKLAICRFGRQDDPPERIRAAVCAKNMDSVPHRIRVNIQLRDRETGRLLPLDSRRRWNYCDDGSMILNGSGGDHVDLEVHYLTENLPAHYTVIWTAELHETDSMTSPVIERLRIEEMLDLPVL